MYYHLLGFAFVVCCVWFCFKVGYIQRAIVKSTPWIFYLHVLLAVLEVSFLLQVCNHFDVIIEPSTHFLNMPVSSFLNKTSFKNGPLCIMQSWHRY